MYKLAIFDFDGTLVDSTPGIVSCMGELIEELGYPKGLLEQWSQLVGVPLLKQMEILFPEKSAQFHEDIANLYRKKYDGRVIDICPPFPGLEDMLAELSSKNVMVSIATSKRRHLVEEVLVHLGLTKYFNMIVGAQDVSNHKPHPESVHVTVSSLQVNPKDAVVIGDSSFDLDMARNAGVDAIGVTTGVHTAEILRKSEPKHVVSGLREVTPIILNGRPVSV
ncbi:MAG TPA: HAD family hydrolase [Candidatus Obscuribacterales bacterium]